MTAVGYAAYKDSGTQWLGEVPIDWELRPLGYFFRERKTTVSDKDFQPLSVTKTGIVPQLETAAKTDNGDNRKLVRAGDFVINSRSDRKGSAGVSMLEGSVSVISTVLEPRGMSGRYVHYLLRSEAFQEEFYRFGTGIVADLWSTRYSAMKLITLPSPPAAEQEGIADFLDRETGKIDALIAKQEQLIAALREVRTATITHAVTKGLDAVVPMTDSGVAWIGLTPANWSVSRFAHLVERANAGEVIDKNWWGDGDELLFTCAREPVRSDFVAFPAWKRSTERDILITRNATPYIHLPPANSIYSNVVQRVTLPENVDRQWMRYALDAASGSMHGYGVSIDTLNFGMWRSLKLPIPQLAEQRDIRAWLDRKCLSIDELVAKADSVIAVLQEYRSALITDAVTGKIDVRGVA